MYLQVTALAAKAEHLSVLPCTAKKTQYTCLARSWSSSGATVTISEIEMLKVNSYN